MKAIILGAGRGKRDGVEVSQHKSLQKDPGGRRALDWVLQSLEQNGIDDISFVGGYQSEKIIAEYPNLRFYINREWETSNIVYSLLKAIEELDDELIICYSDVVFHPSMIEKLLQQHEDMIIVTKSLVEERFQGKSGSIIHKIEKVCTDEGSVIQIGKRSELLSCANEEFIGVLKVTRQGALALKKVLKNSWSTMSVNGFHEADNFQQAYLTDLLQEAIDQGQSIHTLQSKDSWMELDYESSLSKFVFGTKAETLERLQPKLKSAHILDQIRIEVRDWEVQSEYYTTLIQRTFQDRMLIIRSSTFAEDSEESSFAGAFESVLNIPVQENEKIRQGVETVIQSYKDRFVDDIGLNQLLIQPQLEDVDVSGVVMTRDLVSGAPYYTVNYDDESSLTDTITSGNSNLRSLVCLRGHVEAVEDLRLRKLLGVVEEIEEIVGSTRLDIEFAINKDDEIFIFQVRPITTLDASIQSSDEQLEEIVHQSEEVFKEASARQSAHLFGSKTIFANMPDWNPAEIIGVHPKPLAFSLYKYLITDKVWRVSRDEMGYHHPDPEPLMTEFMGQPYIDTRVSFNTLLPASLKAETSEKLMDFYIKQFERDLQIHDKVEFELLYTNYDFGTDARLQILHEHQFLDEEILEVRSALITLTNQIVPGEIASIAKQEQRLITLQTKREYLLNNNPNASLYVVKSLLEDCKEYGTLPFSILARYAFIAVSFLKSFVEKGILSEDDYNQFLKSIDTVASNTIDHLDRVNSREVSVDEFLVTYGHLRPGTYDITSPRYDEAFERYFALEENYPTKKITKQAVEPVITTEQLSKIDKLLVEHELNFSAETLLEFIEKSIVGRESAKFEFSKNLSLALKLLTEIGISKGISKGLLQYATIEDLLMMNYKSKSSLLQTIEEGKKQFSLTARVKLPPVIAHVKDFKAFIHYEDRPNYITQKSILGDVLHLENISDNEVDYTGKIIAIENADPGYDWIFSYEIAGLVTKFGGANSHMAIRCAEFNLPAAIGCGEIIFNNVIQAKRIELICGEQRIEVF